MRLTGLDGTISHGDRDCLRTGMAERVGCPIGHHHLRRSLRTAMLHHISTYSGTSVYRPAGAFATPHRARSTGSTTTPALGMTFWRRFWYGIVYVACRPVLALTISVACVLLVSALNEAWIAAQLDGQVAQARTQNSQLRQSLAGTEDQITQLSSTSSIILVATKLGFVMPTSLAPTSATSTAPSDATTLPTPLYPLPNVTP